MTTVSEIRNLASTAEKAIEVIRRHYRQYDIFRVAHVDVDGGIYDCEFESGFRGAEREYPYREGEKTWADLLIADFERNQKEHYVPEDTLNFSGVMILVVAEDTPIVLQLEDGSLKITMSYPSWEKDREKAILDDLVATFGKMYAE